MCALLNQALANLLRLGTVTVSGGLTDNGTDVGADQLALWGRVWRQNDRATDMRRDGRLSIGGGTMPCHIVVFRLRWRHDNSSPNTNLSQLAQKPAGQASSDGRCFEA